MQLGISHRTQALVLHTCYREIKHLVQPHIFRALPTHSIYPCHRQMFNAALRALSQNAHIQTLEEV